MANLTVEFDSENLVYVPVPGDTDERIVLDGDAMAFIDRVEAALMKFPQLALPTGHGFLQNQYVRQMIAPAGALITSVIHAIENPFFLSKGRCVTWSKEEGVQVLQAPYCGVTKPGTRRIIYVLEEIVWTNVWAIKATNVQEAEEQILIKYTNPLLLE